jgi:amino acid transporter
VPDASAGISGVGYGIVAATLSFGGFEAVSTLGEEISEPARNIPIAILSTVVIAGVFFVLGSYAEVIGFGTNHIAALISSDSPMHDMAVKFGTPPMVLITDLALALSAFGCCLACLSAGARVLFALGRAGMAPFIGTADPRYGTPSMAMVLIGIGALAAYLIWAPEVGAPAYFGNVGTIGAIGLVLVYLGVVTSSVILSMRTARRGLVAIGFCGIALLAWSFYANIFPVPNFPMNFWPYIVMLWIEAGGVILFLHPRLSDVDFSGAELDEPAEEPAG